MNIPSLIILLQVFNGEKFLRQSLASLQSQTFRDYDLYVSDNFSSDSTSSVVADFVSRDSRFNIISPPRFFKNSEDHTNYLLSMTSLWSRYKYLAFRHADDTFLPTMLEEQIHALTRHPSASLCFTDANVVDCHLNMLYVSASRHPSKAQSDKDSLLYSQSDLVRASLLSCATAFTPSVIIRVNALIKRPPSLNNKLFGKAADFGLWLHIAEHGDALIIPKPLFNYRKHSGSDSFLSGRENNKFFGIDLLCYYFLSRKYLPSFLDYTMILRMIFAEAIFRYCQCSDCICDAHFRSRLKSFEGLRFYHVFLLPFSRTGFRVAYELSIVFILQAFEIFYRLSFRQRVYLLDLLDFPVKLAKRCW